MKRNQRSPRKNRRAGYAAVPMVLSFSLLILTGLIAAYRGAMRSQGTASLSQIQVDYQQKEDAILRSLVAILPNRAISVMQPGADIDPRLTWTGIFDDAITLANAQQGTSALMLAATGATNIQGNVGDSGDATAANIVAPMASGAGRVSSGTTASGDLLGHQVFGPVLPAALSAASIVMTADENYPVITHEKGYDSSSIKGLTLDPAAFSEYNIIEYPNIRFGYLEPGAPFVAKRNWWAFSLNFGDATNPDLPVVKKYFVVSLYEIPTQVPISAEGFMSVGKHEGGGDWTNVTVDGGIFAPEVETDGLTMVGGQIAASKQLTVGSGTTVDGQTIEGNLDDLGIRETRLKDVSLVDENYRGDSYTASLAANSGRVAFVSLNQGTSFLNYPTVAPADGAVSPTHWDDYSIGAAQCDVRFFVTEVDPTIPEQLPRTVEMHYKTAAGTDAVHIFDAEPGGNWIPTDVNSPISYNMPDLVGADNSPQLIFYADRLNDFITNATGAHVATPGAPAPANNTICFNMRPDLDSDGRVTAVSDPPIVQDCRLVLREGNDLTEYTDGYSIVTDMPVIFKNNFNQEPIAIPNAATTVLGNAPFAAADITPASPFYPPASVFAPEKYFGYGGTIQRPINFAGQMSGLSSSSGGTFRPLDLKGGVSNANVTGAELAATLEAINNPAALPPIHLVNWLITVEEVVVEEPLD